MPGLVLRMVFAMTVILGIMYGAAKLLRTRITPLQKKNGIAPSFEVIARHSLTRNATLVVTKIGERLMVLGVTDHGVTTITELDTLILNDGSNADWTTHSGDQLIDDSGETRKGMIEQLRELTTRRV